MGFLIRCPNCGSRSYHEFWFGGEIPPGSSEEGTDADYARTWLRNNVAGPQVERWFHYAGCRRWLTAIRDTRTNDFLEEDS